jgi:hypothetical protein
MAVDGKIFFGQTCDNAWWPTRHTVWVIQPENGYKYIGSKAYVWGFWTGLNEKGFGWAGAAVGTKDKVPESTGPGKFEIGPLLLENCATVPEAIALLKSVLPFGPDLPTRNAIMGDAKGNLALLEISYQKVNVETLTKDGYVVRTNHFISDEMKDVDTRPDPYYCDRLERAQEWFDQKLWREDPQWPWYSGKDSGKDSGKHWGKHRSRKGNKINPEDMFGYLTYVYLTRLGNLGSGPGTCMIMDSKELTYWFTYGWPGGNLPPKELESRQICQNMTWGTWIPFYLPELPPGQYTTELGQLTPLGVQYLFTHFSEHPQNRVPAWTRYQSEDPMQPFYKPAEDMFPDGYSPKENPYGPGGFIGEWSSQEGFVPCELSCP